MNCPQCDNPKAEELYHEVDIRVGVQKHTWGCECPDCGMMSLCPECGVWDFQLCNPHMHEVTSD